MTIEEALEKMNRKEIAKGLSYSLALKERQRVMEESPMFNATQAGEFMKKENWKVEP
jgi:hypothetical protein